MVTKLDTRQSTVRETLPQIVSTAGQSLNTVLQNVNSELTPPLVLTPTETPSHIVLVGGITVSNGSTGKKRTVPALSSGIPAFTNGDITFPPSTGGMINFSTVGSTPVLLSCPANQYNKVLIYVDSLGNLGASVGTPAASAAAVVFPATISNTFAAGYVQIHSGSGGLIDMITSAMLYQFSGGGAGGGGGAGASLLDGNFDETFIYYTRSDFAVDKKLFFGSTTGTDSILGLGKVVLGVGQIFTSANILGPVFLVDNPVVNTAQVRLLYNTGKVDATPTVEVSLNGGSSWVSSYKTTVSGNFVIVDFTFAAGLTSTDIRIKVTSTTALSELAGFGVNVVQDNTSGIAGMADFETRIITSTEASTGTITLANIRFTPGAHQLHCNYNGHDFVAPDFVEMGGGVVQFPLGFFVTGDTAKFYVAYGLVNLNNAPTTINNMLSSNDTLGSIVVPTGYTLDKPYMSVPAGATVSGAGNIETTGFVSGDGVLATSGEVLSTGLAPTQPKFDAISEATAGRSVAFPTGINLDPMVLSDAQATRMGLKQYLHGSTYNGGNAPTVSAAINISSIGTVRRAWFIPYQRQDGGWNLKFSITCNGMTTSSAVTHAIAIAGITTKAAVLSYQAVAGGSDGLISYFLMVQNSNTVEWAGTGASTTTAIYVSGDVELESKPTWAY